MNIRGTENTHPDTKSQSAESEFSLAYQEPAYVVVTAVIKNSAMLMIQGLFRMTGLLLQFLYHAGLNGWIR